jgi:hypothetical protein
MGFTLGIVIVVQIVTGLWTVEISINYLRMFPALCHIASA